MTTVSDRYEPFLLEVTEDDPPYEDTTVKDVEASDDGWWVTGNDGWTVFVPRLGIDGRTDVEPKVGDRLCLYGSFGHEIEGVRLNDHVVFYRDSAQREAHRRRWLEDYDARQRREFTVRQGALDAEFAALPDLLKARIQRFREEDPQFRVKGEGYEMFACTEAAKIADALAPRDVLPDIDPEAVVKEFYDLPWEEQKRVVPGLDNGHSGNTFGGACMLARMLIRHRQGEPVSV
jgi:hypothetical protein